MDIRSIRHRGHRFGSEAPLRAPPTKTLKGAVMSLSQIPYEKWWEAKEEMKRNEEAENSSPDEPSSGVTSEGK